MKKNIIALFLITLTTFCFAQKNWTPESSIAGFFTENNSPRKNYSFNQGWRFFKGDNANAFKADFNDAKWDVVNLPHGLELLPLNASGGVNYQGVAWYRKKFTIPENAKKGQIFLHFEAIMGKSEFYINGNKVWTNLGGYTPIIIDVTKIVLQGKINVIAIKTDNSNDPNYPPGKPQETLDFSYFGGIYRDSYLITTNNLYITDSNVAKKVAGGGVFVTYPEVSEKNAKAVVKVDVANQNSAEKNATVQISLSGQKFEKNLTISPNSSSEAVFEFNIPSPKLWSIENPILHKLQVNLSSENELTDSIYIKTGIRSIRIEKSGFYLNGKIVEDKLIGGNRHQDYAHVGNALPNSGQWRDAKKMKEAGMSIVRCAHYPMDPAFMDACDYFGLFIIVATPGWQFWNVKSDFEELVIRDIQNMVRRDRNHASVVFWEPILNETFYPVSFAKRAYDACHAEYPYPGCYAAADSGALGADIFDIIYSHPLNNSLHKDNLVKGEKSLPKLLKNYAKIDKPVFNREWGDNVDNWSSHNSPSRVAKEWGESAQLKQMIHYSNPEYPYTCYNTLFLNPPQFLGGTLWHTFDHNRGYHPDTFWGGIFDAYRQPKYSYFMFKAQTETKTDVPNINAEPFVKILHEMSPFSDKDVWVVTNCDEVELTALGQSYGRIKTVDKNLLSMKHKPVKFENCFNYMKLKSMARALNYIGIKIVANGYINGKKVASDTVLPSYRLNKIKLKLDSENINLTADGSDFIPVVAYLTDKDGTVKRYSNEYIKWTVLGEGKMMDDGTIGINPVKTSWGEAVALIQSTTTAGEIKVIAEVLKSGSEKPLSASITIKSVKPTLKNIVNDSTNNTYIKAGAGQQSFDQENFELKQKIQALQSELSELRVKEVGKQQTAFEK